VSGTASYLGPEGTNAHFAAKQEFSSSIRLVPAPTIAAVFTAVETGQVDCGIVPIENSIEGGVSFTLNRLLESDLKIRGERVIDIQHCLLSRETDLKHVHTVYSHPQALAQCRNWLARQLPSAELVPWASTAGAALEAKARPGAAAIASSFAGQIHGIAVLANDVQDHAENATRFIIIAKQHEKPTGKDKTSIVFSTPHEKGALLRALAVFDRRNINLTRIESRPLPGQMWQYAFFADLEGHQADDNVRAALEEIEALKPESGIFRVFGSYPVDR
jgi:chorismate mutase/prephenate dehydratase